MRNQDNQDTRTSDAEMHDLKEAGRIRISAERFERRGDIITATLFRNAAWRLENGKEWLDDIKIKETR